MKHIPIFVYGTLRPSEYNFRRTGGAVKVDWNMRANGRLYHAFKAPERMYPGARFDEEGTIVGDVLWYKEGSSALRSVVAMEIGAGYSMVEIKVENADGEHMEVYAFQYERPHGERIESGDWLADDAYPDTPGDWDDDWDEGWQNWKEDE